jgi:O-antigen/teichoic acid export membrane protein
VIAALLPIGYVGLYSVGFQAAVALRSLPVYAFPPLLTRMTEAFARRGVPGAVAEFQTLGTRYLWSVLGYGAIATATVAFGIRCWLGPGYGMSEIVGVILIAGFSLHTGITGMRTCFARAVGRPGLETRYSVVAMIINVILTVPLALLFGVPGVAGGTSIALAGGSLYFVHLCHSVAALREHRPSLRYCGAVLLGVGVAVAGDLAVVAMGRHGLLPLTLALISPLAALAMLGAVMRYEASRTPAGQAA